MAFSILSAVKFCRSSRSLSLSERPSISPLISMSSPTADWNLPCTLRRFQDACTRASGRVRERVRVRVRVRLG